MSKRCSRESSFTKPIIRKREEVDGEDILEWTIAKEADGVWILMMLGGEAMVVSTQRWTVKRI